MTTSWKARALFVWIAAAATWAAGVGFGCGSGGDPGSDADADTGTEADTAVEADVETDADVVTDAETETAGDAADADADADAGPEYRFTLRIASDPDGRTSPWLDGAPLPGAGVAVDSGFGRREYVADTSGSVELAVPDDGTAFSVTIAADHHAAVTLQDVTRDDLERWESIHGELFVTLPRIPARGLVTMITVTVRPTGLPAGARWLASVRGSSYHRRVDGATEVSLDVPERSGAIPVLVALLADAAGGGETIVELARTELADGTRSGTVEPAFDGVTDCAIETIEAVALELPSDPASPLRPGSLQPESMLGGAGEPATGLQCGFSLNARETGGAVVFDLVHAAIPDLTLTFGWQLASATTIGSVSASSLSVPFEAGRTYPVLDAPRLTVEGTAPADLGSTFTWPPIADADAYQLDLMFFDPSFGGATLWRVYSVRSTEATLPELPSSHPWPAGWPAPGGDGFAYVSAMRNDHAEGCAGQTDPFCDRSWGSSAIVHLTVER